jgi:hypothetical protein
LERVGGRTRGFQKNAAEEEVAAEEGRRRGKVAEEKKGRRREKKVAEEGCGTLLVAEEAGRREEVAEEERVNTKSRTKKAEEIRRNNRNLNLRTFGTFSLACCCISSLLHSVFFSLSVVVSLSFILSSFPWQPGSVKKS